ncbi:hypothetical protein VTK73DRAFT_4915 [Phialemonium thermophilum]|uniref:ribonuclease Z n=1 Tax=Phialemonium thermophilum TaxID=223376 RepID=A0ABR3V668_9PEZI
MKSWLSHPGRLGRELVQSHHHVHPLLLVRHASEQTRSRRVPPCAPLDLFGNRIIWPVPRHKNSRTPLRCLLVPRPSSRTEDRNPANARPRNMLGFVEILSGPTADTGPCLLVHFESKRYLFGHVAEGTQRVLVGRKMSTRSMEEIFLSGPVRWRSAGGLLGMLLTLGDAAASARAAAEEENRKRAQRGKKLRQASFAALNIHGARNLTHMLATARGFVFRKGFPMRPHEVRTDPRAAAATDGGSDGGSMTSAEPDWQDSNLKVWYVPITCAGEKRASRKRSHDMIEDADGGGQETGASRAKSRDRDGSVAEERVVPDIVQSADDAPGRILVSQASPVQGDVEVSGAPPAGSVAEEATFPRSRSQT